MIVVAVFFLFLIDYLITIIFKRLHPKLVASHRIWDDALLIGLYNPLKIAAWVFGLSLILPVFGKIFGIAYAKFHFIDLFRRVGVILLFLWFFIIFIKQLERNLYAISLSSQKKIDKTSVTAIAQILRLSAIAIVILILMQIFGIPVSGILALGGASGIIIGFAAKDMFANFFGGLMIFLDRPFAIGDLIRSPDKEIEGIVEYIGWRLTRIRTLDRRPLFVPNGLFANISIENGSRMYNRRIKTIIGLRYEDGFKLAKILQDVELMIKKHPDIDANQIYFVRLVNFGHSALEFMVYAFTKTIKLVEFHKVQHDVFLKILKIIDKHGAQCAYPVTTVHFADNAKVALDKAILKGVKKDFEF